MTPEQTRRSKTYSCHINTVFPSVFKCYHPTVVKEKHSFSQYGSIRWGEKAGETRVNQQKLFINYLCRLYKAFFPLPACHPASSPRPPSSLPPAGRENGGRAAAGRWQRGTRNATCGGRVSFRAGKIAERDFPPMCAEPAVLTGRERRCPAALRPGRGGGTRFSPP